MSYNSKYTGAQVEDFLDQIANGEIGGGITEETDPVFSASPAASITEAKKVEWDAKQDAIDDIDAIRSGAAKGATALQSYTEKYTGTITGITMNGVSKGTSGVVDLGTVITAHQDISGKADSSSLAKVATSGSYNDLDNKPTIPSAVTESTVSGWGFTKNQGTITEVKMNGTSKGTSGIVDLGNVITSHQDISGKKDKPNVQNVTTASVSLVLTPNTIYNCTSALTDITISSFNTTSEGYEEYMVLFKSGNATTISLPSDVCWANDEQPEIDADTEYELSISKRVVDGANIFKAILVPFKTIE